MQGMGMTPARTARESGRLRLKHALMGACALTGLALLPTGPAARAAESDPAAKAVKAGDPSLAIELNKLEPHDQGCRTYLVFANRAPQTLESLRLDLIFFGADGVIARRLAVDAGPLRPKKTSVKLFDIANLPCDGIGQVLLNDIPVCAGESQAAPSDCMSGVAVSSRIANVPLIQ